MALGIAGDLHERLLSKFQTRSESLSDFELKTLKVGGATVAWDLAVRLGKQLGVKRQSTPNFHATAVLLSDSVEVAHGNNTAPQPRATELD